MGARPQEDGFPVTLAVSPEIKCVENLDSLIRLFSLETQAIQAPSIAATATQQSADSSASPPREAPAAHRSPSSDRNLAMSEMAQVQDVLSPSGTPSITGRFALIFWLLTGLEKESHEIQGSGPARRRSVDETNAPTSPQQANPSGPAAHLLRDIKLNLEPK